MNVITIRNPWGVKDELGYWDAEEGDAVTIEVAEDPEAVPSAYDLAVAAGLFLNLLEGQLEDEDEWLGQRLMLAADPVGGISGAVEAFLLGHRADIANTILISLN